MQNQNKKMLMWVVGLLVSMMILILLEILIGKAIYPNDPETFKTCFRIMLYIDLFVYMLISTIKIVKYLRFVKEYEQSKVEEAKELIKNERE